MSWLLAIDTSTAQAGVALTNGEQIAETSWPAGRRHTETVLPALVELAGRIGVRLDEIAAVAVATGPGSFSGLRVGMGIAKGFALARGVPLVGVPTLLATASPFLHPSLQVAPVIAAGRRRYVWAVYGTSDGIPVERATPINGQATDLADAVAALGDNVLVCGEMPPGLVGIGHVGGTMQGGARVAAVAEFGWRRWIADDVDDPVRLEPIYLHLATGRGSERNGSGAGRS